MIFTASFFIVAEVNMREIKNYDIRFGEVSCILKKEIPRMTHNFDMKRNGSKRQFLMNESR